MSVRGTVGAYCVHYPSTPPMATLSLMLLSGGAALPAMEGVTEQASQRQVEGW